MSSNTEVTDYGQIPVPDGKQPSEYTYHERRAEIQQLMERRGRPNIDQTQTELAARYDVSQQQISKDFKRVRESMDEHIGDDARVYANLVFGRAVRELQAEGKHYKASKVMSEWMEFMHNVGAVDKTPEKHSVDHNGDHTEPHPPMAEENRDHFESLCADAEDAVKVTEHDPK